MLFRLIFLAIIAALLWVTQSWSTGFHLFETSFIPRTLEIVAVALSGILVVLTSAALILDAGMRRGLGIEPNGAQRVVVYALLTFIATAMAMKYLGSDVTGILTTSALLTAIVGFALQPTLGGLFSGVALQLDRHLKPGSGIIYEGQDTRIESMNWRSVIGRRRDHTQVVIPNAKLAAEAIQIYPDDRATRRDTYFYAPVSIPPQRISKLVRELVSDLTYVEGTHPVMVAPVEQLPDIAALKYRCRYRINYYFEIPEVEGEVFRRIWYGFQRHDIPLPVSRLYAEALRDRQSGPLGFPEGYDLRTAIARATGLKDAALETLADAVSADGHSLLYGPSERLVIPGSWAGKRYLLAAGELSGDNPEFADRRSFGAFPETNARRLFVHKLGGNARLDKLADELAEFVGPYAQKAVEAAALKTDRFEDLCQAVAAEIDDLEARASFLDRALPKQTAVAEAGTVFEAALDVSGQFVSLPHYRAVDEAVIIVLPDDLAQRFPLSEERVNDES